LSGFGAVLPVDLSLNNAPGQMFALEDFKTVRGVKLELTLLFGPAAPDDNPAPALRPAQPVPSGPAPAPLPAGKTAEVRARAEAGSNLGYCYIRGDGGSKDNKESVRWYRKAAEQDFPEAEASLAMCYRLGQGVPEDEREAAHWDRLAAGHG